MVLGTHIKTATTQVLETLLALAQANSGAWIPRNFEELASETNLSTEIVAFVLGQMSLQGIVMFEHKTQGFLLDWLNHETQQQALKAGMKTIRIDALIHDQRLKEDSLEYIRLT